MFRVSFGVRGMSMVNAPANMVAIIGKTAKFLQNGQKCPIFLTIVSKILTFFLIAQKRP